MIAMKAILVAFAVLAGASTAAWSSNPHCKQPGVSCKALIIGNRAYKNGHRPIDSATIDAQQLAQKLAVDWNYQISGRSTGSDSDGHGRDGMREAWRAYLREVEESGAGVALFYFSGHGLELGDDSLLLPIDLPAEPDQASMLTYGLSLRKMFAEFQEVQTRLHDAGKRLDGIFIIDACRVLSRDAGGQRGKSHSWTGGAGLIVPPPGLFTLYAASPGQIAHEFLEKNESGKKPSVFTRRLLEQLTPGRELRLQAVASKVRWAVYSDVKIHFPLQPQTPDYFDRMTGFEIAINGKRVEKKEEEEPAKVPATPTPVKGLPATGARHLIWEREDFPPLYLIPEGPPGKTVTGEPSQLELPHDPPRYAMAVTETTRGQFRAFAEHMKLCPAHPACWQAGPVDGLDGLLETYFPATEGRRAAQNDKMPVTQVSWDDATAYVAWLNTQLGLSVPEGGPFAPLPHGRPGFYRLPTEAEWEFAARGYSTGPFVFGGDLKDTSKLCGYGNGADTSLKSFADFNQFCSDGIGRGLAQAGSYEPNSFGLKDVHGNAWEWVAECWHPDRPVDMTYEHAERGRNSKCRRVARGGSWRSGPAGMTVEARAPFSQGHRRVTLGFRVVRVLSACEFEKDGC